MPKCPSCGQEVAEGMNFCGYCGAGLQSRAIQDMISDARRALSSDPNDASARYNLAIAYKLAGMDSLAVQELARVAELQPDFGDAHFEMGLLHAKSGRAGEAIAALNRVLELDPEHARARELLARLRGRS